MRTPRRSASARTPRTKVTAQDVAQRLGVSVMTVSRALRAAPDVSAETRRRVVETARELGYQPNNAARSLRTGRIPMVAFVTWSPDALRGSYHSETLAGLEAAVTGDGYHVVISVPPREGEIVEMAQRVVAMGLAEAVAIQGSFITEEQIEALRALRAPCTVLNFSGEQIEGDSVLSALGYDNPGGAEQAVRHLAALGHTRIAYIGGTPTDHDAQARERGFRDAMLRLGLPLREDWIRPGHFAHGVECGHTQADHLLAEGDAAPTAIFCASDSIATGALESAHRSGWRVPEDLSVVGFDNQQHSAHLMPALTTVDHSGWALGQRAGQELLRRLREPEEPPQRIVLPTHLVIRRSTAPPRGA